MPPEINTPSLLSGSIRYDEHLLPRVAAYYTYLKALPRRGRKALQRHWHLPLAGVALMLALGQSPTLAATIPVGGNCTLVDAITAANNDAPTGGCPAGSGADTIVLPPGSTQAVAVVNNIYNGPNGLPLIASEITIQGQRSTIQRENGAPEFRLFEVANTGDLTLQDTTVTGGVTAGNLGSAILIGGGIRNNGILTLLNCTISGNSVGGYDGGGGVATYYGSVTISNTIITGNVSVNGGGISNYFGSVTLDSSTVSGNSVSFGGGGIMNFGTLTVLNSSVSDNEGFGYRAAGGGIVNFRTAFVLNSTIAGNSVTGHAGGIYSQAENLTILNSTISSNSASMFGGGGIWNHGFGPVMVLNSTITRNFTPGYGGGIVNLFDGTFIVARTMVSGNTAATASEFTGAAVADNQNVFGVNGNAGVVGFTPGPTDIVPRAGVQLNNILNPVLAFNGGPTQTHALVPGSPAIDAGGPSCTDANGDPLLTDQRGKPRTIDGNKDGTARCDIGAFEFFPIVNNLVMLDSAPDTSFDPASVPGAPAGTFTISATFTNTSNSPLRFPFFIVKELSGDNLLLNGEEGPLGVGATITPNVGDQVLSPGETVSVDFVIGLQTPTPFTFFVDLFAEPVVSPVSKVQRRPSPATKGVRR
jgi:hypothetical protein